MRRLTILLGVAAASLACAKQGTVSSPNESTAPSGNNQNAGEASSEAPSAPVIAAATLSSPESLCERSTTILCEDFESDERGGWSDYADDGFVVRPDEGLRGHAIRQRYALGQVDSGYLGFFFGDHPKGADARAGEHFDEVFLRWYHRFAPDWPGEYPPKMARLRSHYVSCDWCFAWAEHFWLSESGVANSDPFSRIPSPAGAAYVDDSRWLGRVASTLDLSMRDGEWVALEMRVRLNTPGQDDGQVTFWADGEVVLDRSGLNFRGAYDETGINVAMIDTYWNGGSPAEGLDRWYDNVVIATERVGCAEFTVSKDPLAEQSAWSVEIREGEVEEPVWSTGTLEGDGSRVAISETTGTFAEDASPCIRPDGDYRVRARHARDGTWSAWSEWRPLF